MELGRAHVVSAVAALPLLLLLNAACQPAERFRGQAVEPRPEPPKLVGTNWNGEPFELGELHGRVAIVFFGYTYCPDVCPFTLAKMKKLYADLGERADEVSVVFVSVDPGRDTVAKLAQYVPNFDRRFFGVRLEEDELVAAQQEFDLTVQYGQPKQGPGSDSYYYVDHTGTFFLFDREGRLRITFPPTATVDRMLPDVRRLLRG